MAVVIKRKSADLGELVAPVAVAPKVLKLVSSAPEKEPEAVSPRQQNMLVKSGLMDASEVKWEPVMVGQRVKLTSTMFYWVTHWRPGDIAEVTHVMAPSDPLGEDIVGNQMHIMEIVDSPDPSRIKNQVVLARKAFSPVKG